MNRRITKDQFKNANRNERVYVILNVGAYRTIAVMTKLLKDGKMNRILYDLVRKER